MSNPSPLYGKTKGNSCFVHQVVYEETYYARDSGTLEQLKELSTKRQAIEESINGSSKITPAIAREMAGGVTSPVLQVFFLLLLGVIEYFLWVHVWYTVRGQCAKQRGYQTNTDVQKDMQEISSYFSGEQFERLFMCSQSHQEQYEDLATRCGGMHVLQDLQKLERYLPLLENLVTCVEAKKDNPQIIKWTIDLSIRWTSPMSGFTGNRLTGPRYFRLDDLRFELAMVFFLYGGLLRELALEVLPTGMFFLLLGAFSS